MSPSLKIDYVSVIDSTNEKIKQKLTQAWAVGDRLNHFYSLRAGRQLAGRGRMGRAWQGDETGDLTKGDGNLYLSILVQLKNNNISAQISLIAGVTLIESLQETVPNLAPNLSLKWPNDLLFHGKKCAGILCESLTHQDQTHIIIGTGVNLYHHPKNLNEDYQAINLGLSPDFVEAFATIYQQKLYDYIMLAEEAGFNPMRLKWLQYGHKIGELLTIKAPNTAQPMQQGVFADLDLDGSLLLNINPSDCDDKAIDSQAIKRFYVGEIL